MLVLQLSILVYFSESCDVEWRKRSEIKLQLNDAQKDKTEPYVRVSLRTGYIIPFPTQAYVTYEYISKKSYVGESFVEPSLVFILISVLMIDL